MPGHLARAAAASLLLAFSACAVDGGDSPDDQEGGADCTGDKCDDLGSGSGGAVIFNPCLVDLPVGVVRDAGTAPTAPQVIPAGGSLRFPAEKDDRIVTTDVGRVGWREVDWVEEWTEIRLNPRWCPWDVFVESATVSEKTAAGGDWDPYSPGGYSRPDPYVSSLGLGTYDNCQGHGATEGTATSTASDSTTPAWNQETLSWIAWHDMSYAISLKLTDDDFGLGGQLIGTCQVENIPTPNLLPAVVTSDCEGGGSITIRIEPADDHAVNTEGVPAGGSCG